MTFRITARVYLVVTVDAQLSVEVAFGRCACCFLTLLLPPRILPRAHEEGLRGGRHKDTAKDVLPRPAVDAVRVTPLPLLIKPLLALVLVPFRIAHSEVRLVHDEDHASLSLLFAVPLHGLEQPILHTKVR